MSKGFGACGTRLVTVGDGSHYRSYIVLPPVTTVLAAGRHGVEGLLTQLAAALGWKLRQL